MSTYSVIAWYRDHDGVKRHIYASKLSKDEAHAITAEPYGIIIDRLDGEIESIPAWSIIKRECICENVASTVLLRFDT